MGAFETLIKQETEKTVKDSACVFSAPARVISIESNQRYRVIHGFIHIIHRFCLDGHRQYSHDAYIL